MNARPSLGEGAGIADVEGMNISSAYSQADVGSAVGIRVAKMTLDQAKQEGDAANALLAAAVDVQSSSRGAVSATPSSGETGGNLDLAG